ncbi:hypothetical protein K4F52_008880 [Lecanicillium sp. MT-2017a]|nr:hypothetical protein K4F52_008880 [Lecanicillium sp. MT-2017a]
MRDNRYERDRLRSPRRDWDRERDWERDRPRERESVDRRDDRRVSRSRSPFARDRRSPGKATPLGAGGSFRPRSRSPARRDERYQPYRRPSPARDSGISSALPSQPASGRASPLPRVRSPYHSRDQSPRYGDGSASTSLRDGLAGNKSPPRGPAALRNAPTGPSSNRPLGTPGAQPSPSRTPGPVQRSDTASPTMPPSGPRYMPPSKGGFSSRGGRGGWSSQTPTRAGPSPGPSTPLGASGIPTGPRSASISGQGSSTPTHGRPFNPPTGPSAQHGAGGPRQSLAQSLLATMPPLVPGGKLDSSMLPLVLGVSRDVEPHFRKLRDEEEKLRDDLRSKQERLRKSLYVWSRLERDAAAWEMRSELSEKSMKNLAGEGMGGAAF